MSVIPDLPSPIGSIEFERFLFRDAFGSSYRALDRSSGGRVDARLLPEWADAEGLREWVAKISRITHPALVGTLALAEANGHAAVIMEPMDGETLFQRRNRRPRRFFEVSEIKPWFKVMAEALSHLHGEGIVHGAIHGGNVFVEGAQLKLGDLAVSRLLRPVRGDDRILPLPPPAMSPQALAGERPDVGDDVYALGALVYDLLTGKPVFHSGDVTGQVHGVVPPRVAERRRELEIQSAPVPDPWEEWISASLAKDPSDRPSLADLLDMLRVPTTPGAASKSAQPMAKVKAGAHASGGSWLPRLTINQWIMATAALLMIGGGSIIYTQKIAPKNAFKKELEAAFLAVSQYDFEHVREHKEAIEKWDDMLKEWQTRVGGEYPEFESILAAARVQRQARIDQKLQDERTAQADAEARLATRLNKARADYELVRLDTIMRPNEREALVAAWTAFLDKHDVDFEGKPLADSFGSEIMEAKTQREKLAKAVADEVALIESETQKIDGELARLRQQASDPSKPAADKITQIEGLLDQISTQPRVVLKSTKMDDLRKSAESLLAELKVQAERETPKEPLDLVALFATSACKDFSEPGRKRILLAAQKLLKDKGLYLGTPDGAAGKGTHDAILAYQKANNLVPNAALDERTLAALGMIELVDDATPMQSVASTQRRQSSSSKGSASEDKSVGQKAIDGVKGIGKSIGGFFSGKKN